MIDFILNFSLFFLKALTIVVAIIAVVLTIVSASKGEGSQHGLKIEKLNDKYREMAIFTIAVKTQAKQETPRPRKRPQIMPIEKA